MREKFWQELPSFSDFDHSFDQERYTPFDPDWYLIVADIKGSTQAIKAGRYKDVNLIGALCIVAVLNACKTIDIPFVFGGDGASLLVPSSYLDVSRDALLATQLHADANFDLKLRVGAVKVQELYEKGIRLDVAKLKISKDYHQALFRGGGMARADTLIKEDASYGFDLPAYPVEADFTGLECRWQDILSSKDETLSLLVYSPHDLVYKDILAFINKHIGRSEQRHPVQTSTLRLSFSLAQLFHETKAKRKGISRLPFLLKIFFINILGYFLMKFNIRTGDIQWGEYKRQITLTTDSEKFDDMLRMTCAIGRDERAALQEYLQQAFEEKKLCYGVHVSNRAMMTCLIFERMGSQVHFIDAADGGYAMAAIGLKQQLKTLPF